MNLTPPRSTLPDALFPYTTLFRYNLTDEAFYARAFCAKEACSKALGTGIDGAVHWHDLLVDQSTSPPTIALEGGAIERLADITPSRSEERRVGKECVSTSRFRWWP